MSELFKKLTWLSSPFFWGVLISICFSYLSWQYYVNSENPEVMRSSNFYRQLQKINNQSMDIRLLDRGPRKGSDKVAILTVDEESLQKLGRWPFPRKIIAQIIEKTMEQGAKVLAFDVIFSEPQDQTLNALKDIKQRLGTSNKEHIWQKFTQEQDHDDILRQTIEKHQNRLVMGSYYGDTETTSRPIDTCIDTMHEREGSWYFWDENELSVGSQGTETHLPEGWKTLLSRHFDSLDQNVIYEAITAGKLQGVKQKLDALGLKATGKAALALLQNVILENDELLEENFEKVKILEGKGIDYEEFKSQINTSILKREKTDLENTMADKKINYCYRHLGQDDELLPKIEKNWDQLEKDDPYDKLAFTDALDYLRATSKRNLVKQTFRWWLDIPKFAQATTHGGFFAAHLDIDGVIRRADMVVRKGHQLAPSLALKSYMLGSNETATVHFGETEKLPDSRIVTKIDLLNNDGETVGEVPVSYKGQLSINYAGKQTMFPYLSVAELLSSADEIEITERLYDKKSKKWKQVPRKVSKSAFIKGKYFILGVTAVGVYDLRVTPFEENYPGVETHANILDNLIRKDFLRTDPSEELWMPLFILFLGLALSLLIAKSGAVVGFVVSMSAVASMYFIDKYFFFGKGVVVNVFFPMLFILSLYLFMTFYKYLTEERKKKELKGTFQKYVSPSIVNEILKDPSNLELGGQKQHMSVFFSDVRGFTTISEKLDPRALSDLLNAYLTPMTELVFKHNGTLDKYMGDAIMAFFGAPLPTKTHVDEACASALEQLEKLKELQKQFAADGLPIIDVGMGINTGEMSVGNMGSETVRSYTVMGDAVNLGARLEGITKQYGVKIIISEFTEKEMNKDRFFVREVDLVRVKGKVKPVRIFELMGEYELPNYKLQLRDHFNDGFKFYHEKQWTKALDAFEKGAEHQPDDKTSLLYMQRCKDYIITPPAADWDGVFTMTTK